MSNIKKRPLSKLTFRESIILLLVIPVAILIGLGLLFRFATNKKTVETRVQREENAFVQEQAEKVIQLQKLLVDQYRNGTPTEDKKNLVYTLMSPLGVLDPISKLEETMYANSLLNFLFGFYARVFEIPTEDAGQFVTLPLKYASTFNEKEYFNRNKTNLNDIAQYFAMNSTITVLGNWNDSIFRMNNRFVDTERNIMWELDANKGRYYSYKMIDDVDKSEYEEWLRKMWDLKIQVIYKCEDKLILILNGTADNAFGFINKANSSNDINCGLLSNRLGVIKDQKLDVDWHFWIAN